MSDKNINPGEFCWAELMTNDPQQAKDFYSALLGWEFQDLEIDGHGTYSIVKAGEKDIGGIMKIPNSQQHIPPRWMSYIMVEDLDATIKKVSSLNGHIKVPVTSIGQYGRFSVVKDPTGAYIALWESDKNHERSCA